jgi:hypothetical protein
MIGNAAKQFDIVGSIPSTAILIKSKFNNRKRGDFMKLNDKLYNVLKWLIMIVSPALITLITSLTEAWGWNIPLEPIVITIAAITTFIGVIIGISTVNYNNSK